MIKDDRNFHTHTHNMAWKLVVRTNHVLLLVTEIDLFIDNLVVPFPPREACL